jgi:hypothetical protein
VSAKYVGPDGSRFTYSRPALLASDSSLASLRASFGTNQVELRGLAKNDKETTSQLIGVAVASAIEGFKMSQGIPSFGK